MLELSLRTAGWILAHLPESFSRYLAAGLGDLMFFSLPRRRQVVLSNLHHAFENKPAAWHRAIGRESCRRLIETALLSLAMPYIATKRLRAMLRLSPSLDAAVAAHRAADSPDGAGDPGPLLCATVHFCCWEAQTAIPLIASQPCVEFGIIFRPLDNAAADAWVKRSRERFGMRMLSRKAGFHEAMKILRQRGCVALLFDQNAGIHGSLCTLFGRVCSTSELAGVLAEKYQARLLAVYPRRLGFWRAELCADAIVHDGSSSGMTLALNRWLESRLSSSDDACASWLWAHDRWRNQDVPARRLRLEARRDLLAADIAARGLAAIPRKTRLWIRLPNWLGDVVMAIPLLRAIRASRPDAAITLLARAQFLPLLEQFGLADRILPLPAPGVDRFLQFWRFRHEYPDCYLNLPTSFRGDLEACLTRCRQRFGLARRGRRRPLLTHVWRVPDDFDETRQHQVKLWELFLRSFGLDAPPDFSPLRPPGPDRRGTAPVIGLICGSENDPEKRWPEAHWRELIIQTAATRPAARFRLFGTANDQPVTAGVAYGLGPTVSDLAGRTDLAAFAARLTDCTLLIANDTGGMHLANALGVPVLALFGPTSPLRTGPVFDAPVCLLQAPGSTPAGGGDLAALAPETVHAEADRMLAARGC
jgi:ADP-heptose:LPS heptosyltransferase/lauroyl/myristoyl acyltransferase